MAYNYKYYGGNRSTKGGFWGTLSLTIFVILLSVCIIALCISIFSPRGVDGASQLFGYELRIVETNSMQEHPDTDVSAYEIGSFKKNTMVAVELVPEGDGEALDWYSTVKVGDVLTVRYAYDRLVTITHRVTSVEPKEDGSGYIIKLQGDNLNSNSDQLTQEIDTSNENSPNFVIGRVVWKSYPLGFVVGGLQRVTKAFVGE